VNLIGFPRRGEGGKRRETIPPARRRELPCLGMYRKRRKEEGERRNRPGIPEYDGLRLGEEGQRSLTSLFREKNPAISVVPQLKRGEGETAVC